MSDPLLTPSDSLEAKCPECSAPLRVTAEPSGAYGADEFHLYCPTHGELHAIEWGRDRND